MDSEDEVPGDDQSSYATILPSFHSQAVTALSSYGSKLLSGSQDKHVSALIHMHWHNKLLFFYRLTSSHRIKGSTVGYTTFQSHEGIEGIQPSAGTRCVETLPGHWVYQCPAGGHEQQETEENHGHRHGFSREGRSTGEHVTGHHISSKATIMQLSPHPPRLVGGGS